MNTVMLVLMTTTMNSSDFSYTLFLLEFSMSTDDLMSREVATHLALELAVVANDDDDDYDDDDDHSDDDGHSLGHHSSVNCFLLIQMMA